MKAPQVETLDDALLLAQVICEIAGMQRWAWSPQLARVAYQNGTFQKMVDEDWENRWPDEMCAAIAAAYRLSR